MRTSFSVGIRISRHILGAFQIHKLPGSGVTSREDLRRRWVSGSRPGGVGEGSPAYPAGNPTLFQDARLLTEKHELESGPRRTGAAGAGCLRGHPPTGHSRNFPPPRPHRPGRPGRSQAAVTRRRTPAGKGAPSAGAAGFESSQPTASRRTPKKNNGGQLPGAR